MGVGSFLMKNFGGADAAVAQPTTVIVGVLYPRNVHPKVRGGGTEYRQ